MEKSNEEKVYIVKRGDLTNDNMDDYKPKKTKV